MSNLIRVSEALRRFLSVPMRRYVVGLAAVAGLTILSSVVLGTAYPFDIASLTAINALAIMGLSMLYGWSGQISLAHGAFLGLGAYTTAFLRQWTGDVPGGFALELLAVTAVGTVAGLVVGLPALRVTGLQLAILTVAFAEVFAWALIFFIPSRAAPRAYTWALSNWGRCRRPTLGSDSQRRSS